MASLRFSRLILSSLLFSQQNNTAIWNVVTSRSNLPVLKHKCQIFFKIISSSYLFAKVIVPLLMW